MASCSCSVTLCSSLVSSLVLRLLVTLLTVTPAGRRVNLRDTSPFRTPPTTIEHVPRDPCRALYCSNQDPLSRDGRHDHRIPRRRRRRAAPGTRRGARAGEAAPPRGRGDPPGDRGLAALRRHGAGGHPAAGRSLRAGPLLDLPGGARRRHRAPGGELRGSEHPQLRRGSGALSRARSARWRPGRRCSSPTWPTTPGSGTRGTRWPPAG